MVSECLSTRYRLSTKGEKEELDTGRQLLNQVAQADVTINGAGGPHGPRDTLH